MSHLQIWEQIKGVWTQLTSFKGGLGPVQKVQWAHPEFGSLLASVGFDGTIYIYEEQRGLKEHNGKEHSIRFKEMCQLMGRLRSHTHTFG